MSWCGSQIKVLTRTDPMSDKPVLVPWVYMMSRNSSDHTVITSHYDTDQCMASFHLIEIMVFIIVEILTNLVSPADWWSPNLTSSQTLAVVCTSLLSLPPQLKLFCTVYFFHPPLFCRRQKSKRDGEEWRAWEGWGWIDGPEDILRRSLMFRLAFVLVAGWPN